MVTGRTSVAALRRSFGPWRSNSSPIGRPAAAATWWTAAARRPTTQATLPSADHAAEIARLQRENERLRMERDILKKSIAIFAGPRT